MNTARLVSLLGLLAALASTGWGQIVLTGTSSETTIAPGGSSVIYSFSAPSFNLNNATSGTFVITFGGSTTKTIPISTGITTAYLELSAAYDIGSLTLSALDFTSGGLGVSFGTTSGNFNYSVSSSEFKVAPASTDAFVAKVLLTLTPTSSGDFSFGSVTISGTYSGAAATTSLSSNVDTFYALASVPEPSTWAWGGTMLTAGMVTLWRRRRAALLVA